jgi:outer membrane PBP1 activator LpoA protein
MLVSVLAGCAQNPYPPSSPQGRPSSAQLALNQALSSQDPKQIATAQMNLAAQAQGQTRAELQMQAIETAIDAEDFTLANTLLAQANTQNTWPAISPRRAQLLSGFSLWQQGQTKNALNQVNNLPIPLTPAEGQRRLVLLAAINEALGRPLDAARQRSALNAVLSGALADANRAKLWNDLTLASPNQLSEATKQASDQTYAGWLGLALLYRTRPSELSTWIKNHPDHPAVTSGFTTVLVGQADAAAHIPDVTGNRPIIVLLPLTGEYQPIAKAISDGINFAHDRLGAASDRAVQIQDSGTTVQSFSQALSSALATNPSLIIGPLLKEQIAALNNMPATAPAVIALNTPPDGAALPTGVVSFSLSPDADARATADQMIRDQKMTALTLCADNGAGHRICDAFSREYRLLGGTVVDGALFNPQATDFSNVLRNLLQVRSSSSSSFQPKIRNDVQGIFVGATSQQARMIVPQLDYFGADQLPRYSIGMVYSGTPNPLADQDKNGLVIPVEPVLLAANDGPNDPMLANYERASLSQLPRLFAFGADAMSIAANLNALLDHHTINGLTGQLSFSLTGEIERKPAWAQFRQGLLQPMSGTDTGLLPSTVLGAEPASTPALSPSSQDAAGMNPPPHPIRNTQTGDTQAPASITPNTPPTFTDGGGLAPSPTAQ